MSLEQTDCQISGLVYSPASPMSFLFDCDTGLSQQSTVVASLKAAIYVMCPILVVGTVLLY